MFTDLPQATASEGLSWGLDPGPHPGDHGLTHTPCCLPPFARWKVFRPDLASLEAQSSLFGNVVLWTGDCKGRFPKHLLVMARQQRGRVNGLICSCEGERCQMGLSYRVSMLPLFLILR